VYVVACETGFTKKEIEELYYDNIDQDGLFWYIEQMEKQKERSKSTE